VSSQFRLVCPFLWGDEVGELIGAAIGFALVAGLYALGISRGLDWALKPLPVPDLDRENDED